MSAGPSRVDIPATSPWDLAAFTWLEQYAIQVREAPDRFAALSVDTARFELMPVPRALLDALASRRRVGP